VKVEADKQVLTVLNVDDNEAGRYAITRVLQRAGYRVVEASSGAQTMMQLEKEPVDLVILDINLPDANGLDLCFQIKADPRFKHLPVLHLTATYVMSVDKLEESCADGYLMQPVEPAALLANVRSLIQARREEARLRDGYELWQAGLDSLDVGVAVVDWNGNVLQANKHFTELRGVRPLSAELRGLLREAKNSRTKQTAELNMGGETIQAEVFPIREHEDGAVGAALLLRLLPEVAPYR
jgi:DNA-binding response OmpR family regulator